MICKQCECEYFGKRRDSLFCNEKCKKHHHYLYNKEKYILTAKQWGGNNIEKRKESLRKYNNKAERKKVMREYRRQNKEKLSTLAKSRRWRNIETYREKQRIQQRKRRETPKGRLRMHIENKRRALSKGIWFMMKKAGVGVSNMEKKKIVDKLKTMENCTYCGCKTYKKGEGGYTSRNEKEIDHILPLNEKANKKYANIIKNLTIACASCNSSKHDSDIIEWANIKNIILPKSIVEYVQEQKVIIYG